MKEQEILEQIETWYKEDKHQKIVDLIESLPKAEQTPTLISELGRAYNNVYWMDVEKNGDAPLKKAKEVLLQVEPALKEDFKWHYRIAYTYFFLNDAEKASYHFKQSESLSDEKYPEYLRAIEIAQEKDLTLSDALDLVWEEEGYYDGPTAYYTEDQMERLENFIEANYGKIDSVFHELVSPEIHCDIYVIKPTEEKNYYTLITGGMGAYKMSIPEGFREYNRAELMIHLPADWDISNEEEKWYWPIRWLKILARLPITQNTFLGWGHTVPTGEPLEGTNFDCFMLLTSLNNNGENVAFELDQDKTIAFYTVFPLFEEETLYKLDNDAEALLEKFDQIELPYPPVVDLNRPNACEGYQAQPNVNLLNGIKWIFTPNVYNSLMNFVVDVDVYNKELDNKLVDLNPFATIFTSDKVKLMYQAFIKSKEDILAHETLLMEEETFAQEPEDGYYFARILAELNSEQDHIFSALNLLLQIQNTLANKELGPYIHFEDLEIQGYEDDGTPVVYLVLKP